MYSHIFKKIAIVGIVLTSIAYSCDSEPCCEDGEIGTIKDFKGLDGCSYVVELQDESKIQVTNLSEFDIDIEDGKTIRISYHEIKDAMSICMIGKIVEADCICYE